MLRVVPNEGLRYSSSSPARASGGSHLDFDTGREISPEQTLWLAVVGRCWLDAFESITGRANDPSIVRAEARRWLVHDFADWKSDRKMVCEMAGVDSDVIRDAARRRLKETRMTKAMELDRAFVALVACSESMDGVAPDKALAQTRDFTHLTDHGRSGL